jgi:hypothetical protein
MVRSSCRDGRMQSRKKAPAEGGKLAILIYAYVAGS